MDSKFQLMTETHSANVQQPDRYASKVIPLAAGTPDVAELHSYWRNKCAGKAFALRRDIDPPEIRHFLGRICLLEIVRAPLDFIYRLDGSTIAATANEDLKDRSILEARPPLVARKIYNDLSFSSERAEPVLWEIDCHYNAERFLYQRLILPLSKSGGRYDYMMTFSHSLLSEDGDFRALQRGAIRPDPGA